MFEENEDLEDFTNDNDFSEDEEDTTELNLEDEGNETKDANMSENNFKLVTFNNVLENIQKNPKKTIPILTKFERARIVGVRLQQLAYGAKPRINTSNLKNIQEIVQQELIQRKIPFIIRRRLPNGTAEDWKLEEFETV